MTEIRIAAVAILAFTGGLLRDLATWTIPTLASLDWSDGFWLCAFVIGWGLLQALGSFGLLRLAYRLWTARLDWYGIAEHLARKASRARDEADCADWLDREGRR